MCKLDIYVFIIVEYFRIYMLIRYVCFYLCRILSDMC